jgi:hypothetical protein
LLAIFLFPVIWKDQVVLVVGAASSRDHLISRLKAAPTRVFYGYLDFPDKRLLIYGDEYEKNPQNPVNPV